FEIDLPTHTGNQRRQRIPLDVSGSRVLIVDDNEVNRSILVENLQSWHFESAAAASGAEAMAALHAMYKSGVFPDCLILDYHMPEMNGAQLAMAIRADEILSNLPIIMLTSVDQMENGKNFSSLGIEGHLVKPARSSVLLETVIQVLQDVKLGDSELRQGVHVAKSMSEIGMDDSVVPSQPATVVDANPSAPAITLSQIGESVAMSRPAAPEVSVQPDTNSIETAPEPVASLAPAVVSTPQPQESVTNVTELDVNQTRPIEPSTKIDILVAEDNEVNQLVISQILQATGYSYLIAENGKKAVELYEKHRPKLICMDVSMPVMNGHEATEEIRRLEAESGLMTPIIGVTAHAIKGDMERCFEAGMDDYISKPVSPERLEEKIALWMSGQGKSQRIA
ncbi:MAG: response regulator, partial [Pseudomonadota bacterium]